MEQESVQKNKTAPEITFEELCPEWDSVISAEGGFQNVDTNKKYNDGKNTICDYGCCIVGNAFSLE